MPIIQSPYPPVPLTDLTITERVFQGLTDRLTDTVLIDGPTGRELTAADLIEGIKQLAGGLTERGLAPGRVIAVMAPNMPEFATVFHGILWAGNIVTTINPAYTHHEVRHQLHDSGAVMLITVPALAETARTASSDTAVKQVAVIGEATDKTIPLAALMGPPLAHQAPVDVANDIAALPYSSGTTGLPKGVMLTHRNLVVNVDQTCKLVNIAPGEPTVAFLPFFHIYGQTVLLNHYLAAGGRLITLPRFDLELYLRLVRDHATPRLWCVPPVAVALAKHPLVDAYDMTAVRVVFSGAAPLGADVADAVAARLGALALQGYGMTELSPVSHATPAEAPRSGSSGLTLPNTSCRIVDPESLRDKATGEAGELWVRGPQVMKGYLNNPSATAATITPDGWLRTGDLAAFDADGYLYIHDRVKELIKYKGFQVAPAELEAELLNHPAVTDAAVIGRPDDEAGEVPVAFVVTAPGAVPNEASIMAHMAERLAHFKQLHAVTFVDSIPKSASGKILRRLLKSAA